MDFGRPVRRRSFLALSAAAGVAGVVLLGARGMAQAERRQAPADVPAAEVPLAAGAAGHRGRRRVHPALPHRRPGGGAGGPAPADRRHPVARPGDGRRRVAGRATRHRAGSSPATGRPTTTGARSRRRLNALPQFVTEIDGLDIHFIHVRSKHANALPLIVTHGWPGSVIEQLKIIDPLTDPTAHGGERGGRVRRRDPVAAGLRLLRQADRAGLDPGRDRRGLGRR